METNNRSSGLLFEHVFQQAALFLRSYRIPFLSALLIGLLGHGFAFTNKYINHDEIFNLFGKGATLDSGRWALGALDSIFPNYSMPWIYGILTVSLIAVAACLIVHTFAIRNPFLQALLAGSLVVFPVWTSTFAFMFTSSSYGVAFLMASLSVTLLRRQHPFWWIFALGCGILSVAIYQAYIAVIAALLVLMLIQDLLLEEDLWKVLRRGFFYVLFLILTLGLYYIALQILLILKHVTFNLYAQERNSFQLASLPDNIRLAYAHFIRAFDTGEFALIPFQFTRNLHLFCLCVCAFLLLVCFLTKKMQLPRILFILALLLVFPLAVNCMYLFTLEAGIHTLVLCGFMSIYVALVLIADLSISTVAPHKYIDFLRRISLNLFLLVLSVIIITNTYFANEAYLQLHLQYENTYAFYTSLLSDIRAQPEFDEDTRLAVIGEWNYPDYFFRKFDFTYHLFGHLDCSPAEYSMDRFLEYYLGFPIPFAESWVQEEIQNSTEYLQMPVYPYYGSIQMFDDILVVKLS